MGTGCGSKAGGFFVPLTSGRPPQMLLGIRRNLALRELASLLMERLGVQPAPGSQTYVAMPRRQKTRPRAVSQHRRSEGALPTEPDPLELG